MGRPRSFDEEEVLDRALQLFWARGYTATSVADLEAAMEIKAGSIYKAFGDKRSLFIRAMQRYLDEGRRTTAEALASGSPVEALRRLLYGIVDMATARPSRGCFAVNCAIELAPHDDEVRTTLGQHDRRMTRLFTDLVTRGQAAGQLRSGEPKLYARQLQVFINGLQVEGKKGLRRPEARRLVDQLLETLAA